MLNNTKSHIKRRRGRIYYLFCRMKLAFCYGTLNKFNMSSCGETFFLEIEANIVIL